MFRLLFGTSRLAALDGMIVCTGRSSAHLRRLSTVIVRALKKRKLRSRAPGATGAEGEGDWVVVDCGNWLVHAMDAHSRKCIRLEEHWKRPETCQMPEGRNEQEVEDKLDMLVAANPVPDEYNVDITSDDTLFRLR
mmetsp:Transcript_13636/g.32283  ORF Transcript_13636/g.32283 Transcript_13636/m.32283 type:complete len:136 (-) Transcript_13636:251-658(-)